MLEEESDTDIAGSLVDGDGKFMLIGTDNKTKMALVVLYAVVSNDVNLKWPCLIVEQLRVH